MEAQRRQHTFAWWRYAGLALSRARGKGTADVLLPAASGALLAFAAADLPRKLQELGGAVQLPGGRHRHGPAQALQLDVAGVAFQSRNGIAP